MSYTRFGLMILTSTVVMFGLMYLNTYAWAHVYFSETRAYMAVMMGAAMAIVMLAFMLGMYADRRVNIAIFVGAALVFGLTLWLVRSQVTVSGTSYMRAMIPHHSIAIMTSERAQIRDPRVRKLADEIIAAQRREIAEMQYLIDAAPAADGAGTPDSAPPAAPGSLADALASTQVSRLDLAPMARDEAAAVLGAAPACGFRRSPQSDPVLWVGPGGGRAAMKMNGVLVALEGGAAADGGAALFGTEGAAVALRRLEDAPAADDAGGWQPADLVFDLDAGLRVGYRGAFGCL